MHSDMIDNMAGYQTSKMLIKLVANCKHKVIDCNAARDHTNTHTQSHKYKNELYSTAAYNCIDIFHINV